VSRRSIGPLRKILPVVAVGLVALGIAGCSSGQATQTDQMPPAVNGNTGDVGDIALRDIVIAYPANDSYREGDDAPLTLAIVNTGGTDDELTAVSSPASGTVELLGDTTVPARSALSVVVPDASATSTEPSPSSTSAEPATESSEPSGSAESSGSAEPSESAESSEVTAAPDVVGTLSILLRDLTADLPMGKNVPITFSFAEAGEITITVPIDTPGTALDE
jgi:copper(I)-binding protein